MMVTAVRMCWRHGIAKRTERKRFTPVSGKYTRRRNDRCANSAARSALAHSPIPAEAQAHAPAQRETCAQAEGC